MARFRQAPAWSREAGSTPSEKPPIVKRIESDGQIGLPLTEARLPATPLAASPATRLWFAIYLPCLSLEAVAAGDRVCAVVEEQQGVHRVVAADMRALEAGVMSGQTSQAALALLAELHIVVRSELHEQQTLERLASWLEDFSSFVVIAERDLLLLEIAGSLKLFGGLKQLRRKIVTGLERQGFSVSLAIAPTPLAATWFSRADARVCIRDNNRLLPMLRELPLSCLHWPRATCDALQGIGVSTVGDCLRLPRDGFAKRYGVTRLLELDRALGRLPDPRDAWRTPERFVADFEMTEEQSDRELLLKICEELLRTHERFLLKRQLGTQLLEFGFYHLKSPATELSVGSVELSRAACHWFDLLRIRFEGVQLPESVIAVRLRSGDARPLETTSSELSFSAETRDTPRYSMAQLAERLIARIGRRSVRGMTMRHDHRPQFAARDDDVLKRASTSSVNASWVEDLRRPLWLLKEPRLLQTAQGQPVYRGVLRLTEGPERFETGWWDRHAMSRDYFIAVNPQGLRLWIFRERKVDGGWYLHGLFG